MVTRDELKKLIDDKGKYTLIDVRGEDELVNGMIPTAVHLPLGEISWAFTLSPEAFERKYKFKKPINEKVIFYCRTGSRSAMATSKGKEIGLDCDNYAGSIWEWSEIDPNVKRYEH